jgi:hypothetical protein
VKKKTPATKARKATKPKTKVKAAAAGKKAPPKKAAPAPKVYAQRADLGAPVAGFFAKQAPALRPILDELRAMVGDAAPEATSQIKWGMPFYSIGEEMVCALAGFKAHVNLILPGPPGTYPDPDNRLEGDGKTGKHLKLRALADLPHAAVRDWLRVAAERARGAAR